MVKRALLVAVLAVLALAPLARADGDPASDWLLSQPSFLPIDVHVPKPYVAQLTAIQQDAKAHGYQVRVAVIGTRYDMGAIPELYGKPTEYARFLGKELYFVYKGKLLVVMPQGLAASKGGVLQPSMTAAVEHLPAPGKSGQALVAAATRGVQRLAATQGVDVKIPPLQSASSGSSTNQDRLILAAVGIVLLLLITAASMRVRRVRRPA